MATTSDKLAQLHKEREEIRAKLQKKENQLLERIKDEKRKIAARERKEETRALILMGRMLLNNMKENPEALVRTQNKMNEYLTSERDKAVVNTVINRIEKKEK
jgi:hypothetical protein